MIALVIGLTLFAAVVLALVRMGCRAIREFCAQLERDRRVEYRCPVPPTGHRSPTTAHRNCPDWLRRACA